MAETQARIHYTIKTKGGDPLWDGLAVVPPAVGDFVTLPALGRFRVVRREWETASVLGQSYRAWGHLEGDLACVTLIVTRAKNEGARRG